MHGLLSAWLCCLSLSLALPLPPRTQRHRSLRSGFLRLPRLLDSSPSPKPPISNPSVAPDHNTASVHKGPPPGVSNQLPDQKHGAPGEGLPWQRASRGRRHAQLMRVGCVLGTCQVQNLSHRLYQLIGQSGREDSSPINPRSPHSYG